MANILLFSPHPDDVEMCLGGTILLYSQKYSIKIIQMTNGEAATNGDELTRRKEEEAAIKFFKNVSIEYLNISDLEINSNNLEQIGKVVKRIRKEKPSVIFLPSKNDSHLDHKETNKLIMKGVAIAAIRKKTDEEAPHYCKMLFTYSSDLQLRSNSIYIDISKVHDEKMKILKKYTSQLEQEGKRKTYLNSYALQKIVAKDTYCGALIQAEYAEEIIPIMPLKVNNLFSLV